jgi:hypothetical protein
MLSAVTYRVASDDCIERRLYLKITFQGTANDVVLEL